MQISIRRQFQQNEFWFHEGCFITEIANDEEDDTCSIARARVEPGQTTAWHMLEGVEERYIIVTGVGRAEFGENVCCDVAPGDVVRIPRNTRQRITNTGRDDLVFYAVCTPPFSSGCYVSL